MSRERYHRLPAALKQQYDEGLLDELESFVGASSQDPQLVVSEILSCAYAARPHFLHVVAFPRLLIRYLYTTAPHYSCFICFLGLVCVCPLSGYHGSIAWQYVKVHIFRLCLSFRLAGFSRLLGHQSLQLVAAFLPAGLKYITYSTFLRYHND